MAGMVSAAEGAILKGANTVATTRQELDGRIKQVESQILAIGSNWQGSAAVAFQALMVRWNEDTRKVNNALIQFEENLRRTQQDYDATDQDQAAIFNKLASRLR